MENTKIICNKEFAIGKIDPRLYGSFLEHMGRVIYTGIYNQIIKAQMRMDFVKTCWNR